MEIEKRENSIIIDDYSGLFDIEKTLECGQVFRFFKNSQQNYDVISTDKHCNIYRKEDQVIIKTDFVEYFYKYFDLFTDYDIINKGLKSFSELNGKIESGRGIRILNQDLFETIISFIISANNNIPRIKGIIEKICLNYGQKLDFRYAFPTLEQFSNITEQEFRSYGAGFRAPYLYQTAQVLKDKSFLLDLKSANDNDALKKLLTLKGVGPKVANCIMFFALNRTNSYPVDTWIFKANRTEELDTVQKVSEYYSKRYGNLAGYAQQYIFYSARNLKQE